MDINVKNYDTIVGKFEFEPYGEYVIRSVDINFCNIIGLEESADITMNEILADDSYGFFKDAVDEAKNTGCEMRVCVTLDTTSEHNIVTYITGVYDKNENIIKASLIDITMMSTGLDFNSTVYSRTEYEFILNNIECPVMMFDFNMEPKIIFANRSYYSMIGYSSEEVIQVYNRSANAFVRFEDKEKYRSEEDINLKDDKFTIALTINTKLEGPLPITMIGQKITLNDGRIVALCVFYQNKKEIQLNKMVEHYRDRFDMTLKLTNDIFFEIDFIAQKITFYNYEFDRIKPGTPIDFEESTFNNNNRFHPKDYTRLCELEFNSEDREIKTTSIRMMNKKGFYEKYTLDIMPVFDEDGENTALFFKAVNENSEMYSSKMSNRINNKLGVVKFDECREIINGYINAYRDVPGIVHEILLINIDNYETLKEAYTEEELNVFKEMFIKVLKSMMRREDIVSQIADQMFLVFEGGMFGYEWAKVIPEDIKESIEAMNVPDNAIKPKLSIGVSIWPDNGENYDMLFEKTLITLNRQRRSRESGILFYNNEFSKLISDESYKEDINYKAIEEYITNQFNKMAGTFFTDTSDKAVAIHYMLASTGSYFGLDRIKIIDLYDDNERIMYFWNKSGIKNNNDLEWQYMQKHNRKITNGENVYIVNDFNEISNEHIAQIAAELETSAIMQRNIVVAGVTVGYILFEKALGAHVWSFAEKIAADFIVDMLGKEIYEKDSKAALERELPGYMADESVPLYVVDKETMKIDSNNLAFDRIFGNNCKGQKCYKAIFGYESPCKNCVLASKAVNGIKTREVYDNKRDVWLSQRAAKSSEKSEKYYVTIVDITSFVERINAKDALTKLDSVDVFKHKMKKKMANISEYGYGLATIDFDKFKDVNQTIGYAKADELIVDYSEYMTEILSPDEMLCHVSADKFMLLFAYKKDDDILQYISTKNDAVIEKINDKYKAVQLSTTTGIYCMKPSDYDINIAIDKANIASKTVKNVRHTSYAIYDDEMERQAIREKEIENKMYRALKNHEFVIYYQPKTDLKTEGVTGAEALVRWQDKPGHLVPPMDFIPLFERNGFIIDLDYYIFEEVFKFIRKTIDEGRRPIPVSLNVSRAHIYEPDFVEKLMKIKEKYNIDTKLIELELTEGTFLTDQYMILKLMKELKKLGFKISIDDFGSGFSSLNMLKDLPIDVLKLDKEFFPKGDMDERVKTIFVNVVRMTKELNIIPLTEGVETKEQAEFLREVGCVLAQGYYYSRPLPEADFIKYLSEHEIIEI